MRSMKFSFSSSFVFCVHYACSFTKAMSPNDRAFCFVLCRKFDFYNHMKTPSVDLEAVSVMKFLGRS